MDLQPEEERPGGGGVTAPGRLGRGWAHLGTSLGQAWTLDLPLGGAPASNLLSYWSPSAPGGAGGGTSLSSSS